jgi:hypothetical protein
MSASEMPARSRARGDSALPLQRPGLWLRVSEDETVIVDQDSSSLHVVNETALALWELCNGENTVAEMVTAICELFGESAAVVVRDVEGTLARFDAAGLLSWTPRNPLEANARRGAGHRTNG